MRNCLSELFKRTNCNLFNNKWVFPQNDGQTINVLLFLALLSILLLLFSLIIIIRVCSSCEASFAVLLFIILLF